MRKTVSIDVSTSSVTLPTDPVKEGYIFGGWYYDENTWKKPLSVSSLLDTSLSNKIELTVYARFMTEEDAALGDMTNVGVIDSGKCGENVFWKYYENDALVFTGYGEMLEYYDDVWYIASNVLIPWHPYAQMIKTIVIADGITTIPAFAFLDCKTVKSITIPESVRKIGHCAFEHWNDYEGLVISNSVSELGNMVFHSCSFNVYYNGSEEEFNAIKKAQYRIRFSKIYMKNMKMTNKPWRRPLKKSRNCIHGMGNLTVDCCFTATMHNTAVGIM